MRRWRYFYISHINIVQTAKINKIYIYVRQNKVIKNHRNRYLPLTPPARNKVAELEHSCRLTLQEINRTVLFVTISG